MFGTFSNRLFLALTKGASPEREPLSKICSPSIRERLHNICARPPHLTLFLSRPASSLLISHRRGACALHVLRPPPASRPRFHLKYLRRPPPSTGGKSGRLLDQPGKYRRRDSCQITACSCSVRGRRSSRYSPPDTVTLRDEPLRDQTGAV